MDILARLRAGALRFLTSPVPWAAAVAFLAARSAMLPGLGFWDTGEYQTVAPIMGTAHPTGFPAYVVTGFLFSHLAAPLGEPAFLMNLFSALLLAVAAGITADLVRRLTGSRLLGLVAGIGLALTPIVWHIGTAADAHALHLALIAGVIWSLVRWSGDASDVRQGRWLMLAAALYGVALANHMLTSLLAPAIAIYVLSVEPSLLWRKFRLALACLGTVVVVAVLLYLELPLRAGLFRAPLVYGHPETWDGFLYVVMGQQFQNAVGDSFGHLDVKLGDLAAFAQTQFGILTLAIPAGFLATLFRAPRYALFSGLAVLATVIFAATYINAGIERYYLVPVLLAWTWLAFAATSFSEWAAMILTPIAARAGAAAPAVFGSFAGTVLLAVALIWPSVAAAPTTYAGTNNSRDTRAQEWVDDALAALPPHAVVVSWWSYSTPIWYAQYVEGLRPDITLLDDRTRLDRNLGSIEDTINAYLSKEPVFVIRPGDDEIEHLAQEYHLRPLPGNVGNIYEVLAPLDFAP